MDNLGGIGRSVHRFGLAVQFLTRLPVRISGEVSEKDLAASMVFYPVVGTLIGLALACFGLGLHLVLPTAVAALWVVVGSVIVTGNLHVDGLMDTADGLFGSYEPKRRLAIMKDSRAGAHGVVAAILCLLMKAFLLMQFAAARWWTVLPVSLAFARWALVYGAFRFQYARPEGGLGRAFVDQVKGQQLLGATVMVLGIGWLSLPSFLHLAGAAIGTWFVATCTGRYIAAKIGGMTGDTLGALNEIVELAVTTFMVVIVL